MDNPGLQDEKRDVHLLDYWRTIWRGRWTVLSIFVVVVTLVAVGTFTQKPVYRGIATVEINPQSRKVSPVADVAEMGTGSYGWLGEERYFNTQYEIIKSRDVARRVFDRLDLYNHPLFKGESDPVDSFAHMIQVDPVKDTGIVEIGIEGGDPTEVQTWVNTVAEAYVERNLALSVEATSRAVKALLSEIAPLREKLEDTQRDSFEFAQKANLFVPENQQKIRNDKVVQELYAEKVGLEREYERLLLTYKEKHIRVQEKQSEIAKIDQKIAAEADRIISNIRTQYALLKDREDKLVRSIEETRTDSLRLNQKASSYDLVRGEATETKRIYDLISARVKEIDLSASLLSNNLRILDKASLPRSPVRPRTALNLSVGLLLGLLLGVGTVFFLDYLDNTVRTSEDIEQYLKLNLLAIVPKQTEETGTAVKEAYQTLRTSLLFSRKSRAANAVLITSAGPQEGKSCTAVNVARTLATGGEMVIVLDCDLRRPAIHQRLDIGRDMGIT